MKKSIFIIIIILATSAIVHSGEATFKIGYQPKDCISQGCWRIGFCYDAMIWGNFGIGGEIHSYYWSIEGDSSIPLNLFVHIKGKSRPRFVRFYYGAGFGILSYIIGADVTGPALQTFLGLETKLYKRLSLIAEIQIDFALASMPGQYYFFSGLKW